MGGGDSVRGHIKNILSVIAPVLLLLLISFCFLTFRTGKAYYGFKARMAQKNASTPLFLRAEKLGITYKSALDSPACALGKPVLWCVHFSSSQVYYGPGKDRPLDVTNPEQMPATIYPRYAGEYSCQNALMEITAVRTFDYSGARAMRVQTRFLDYP